ncbi:MAG: type II secretion system F family protein [Lachnospiraceae bacterium]|nr:type II secretion system F family protein [Lachnospiraceae bacterium]
MLLAGLSWLFFHSLLATLFLLPLLYVLHDEKEKGRREKREHEKRVMCKDAVMSLASSMAAGYSLENALIRSRQELVRLWGDDAYIVDRWRKMEWQVHGMHVPAEEAFAEFAKESGVSEVELLSQLLSVSKRTGGSMVRLLKMCAKQLADGLTVEEEIQAGITQVKFEGKIMTYMPPAILLYLQVGSPDIIQPLYITVVGRITMIVCLILYFVAIVVGRKMAVIRV